MGLGKVLGAITMGIRTRKKFSKSGICRRAVISSSYSKDEVKEVERSRKPHTFRNIKSSELSATHFPIPPLAVNRVQTRLGGCSPPLILTTTRVRVAEHGRYEAVDAQQRRKKASSTPILLFIHQREVKVHLLDNLLWFL